MIRGAVIGLISIDKLYLASNKTTMPLSLNDSALSG